MIKMFRIKNFKCFREVSFPFSQLTILSGINSSGKSTLIQSMLMLRQSVMLKTFSELGMLINGPLVRLGDAQDLFHEAPGSDSTNSIEFELEFDEGKDLKYEFTKNEDRLKLVNPEQIKKINITEVMNLFNVDSFYYLNAERKGPRITFPY